VLRDVLLMQSSATIDWWEQDWNEVMMSRLLKLSEAKQREHVHLGDVGHSAHGKYDVCTFVVMLFFSLLFLFIFHLICLSISEYSHIFVVFILLYSSTIHLLLCQ